MEQERDKRSWERVFEGALWRSRFIVLLAVVASLVSAVILFLWASADVARLAYKSVTYVAAAPHSTEECDEFHSVVVGHVMILIVTFFKNVIHTDFHEPLGIFYLGVGILFVALALHFSAKPGYGAEK